MRYLHLFVALIFVSLQLDAQNAKFPRFKAPKGFVLIEGAIYQLTPEARVPVNSFYISSTEVSNKQYKTFLDDLQKQGKTKEYETAKIRQAETDPLNENFPKDYATNAAYDEYPVVNITREGMELYCQWLNAQLKQDKDSEYNLLVRLPSALEWEFAATGGTATKNLPWEGNSLRNSKGVYLANYYTGTDKKAPFIAPVKSYEPTKNGLYNMIGNVGEMTNDPTRVVKGGSWNATETDVLIHNNDYLRNATWPSSAIGFRPVIGIYPKSGMEK